MKNLITCLYILLVSMLLPLQSFGQIEVHDNGQVSIGGNPANRPPGQTFINGGSSYAALTIKSNNFNPYAYAVNTILPKFSSTTYNITTLGKSMFYVRGDGMVYSFFNSIWSDSTLKKNVTTIDNALNKVLNLRGVYYYYLDSLPTDTGGYIPFDDSTRHMGLIAQEVEDVIPEVVTFSKDSTKAVSYANLVALLIEAIKRQQQVIDSLKQGMLEMDQRLNDFDQRLTMCCPMSLNNTDSTEMESSYFFTPVEGPNEGEQSVGRNLLYQNKPNPYKDRTTIKYELGKEVKNAYIVIHDLQGLELRNYRLVAAPGGGSILIEGSDMKAGMYNYTLVVDDNIVATKKMLLTK